MSADKKYCIHCGAEIILQAASETTSASSAHKAVCPSCGKDPAPGEHLFREFLLEHTKDKLKGEIDDRLYNIIKNWLLSHLYGFVMSIAVIAAAVITVNAVTIHHGVRKFNAEPTSVSEAKSSGQSGEALPADTADTDVSAHEGSSAAESSAEQGSSGKGTSSDTSEEDSSAQSEEASWWPFGSKRWKTMTRYFEEGSASFTYNYDERGRLTSIENHFNGTTDTTVCECDEDGRWLRQENSESTAVYSYDSEGRLVSMVSEEHITEDGMVFEGTDTYTYSYDDTGKIISGSITGRSTSHMEGNPDTIEERTGTETYVYDENDVLLRVLVHYDFNVYIADGSGYAFSDPLDITEEYGY